MFVRISGRVPPTYPDTARGSDPENGQRRFVDDIRARLEALGMQSVRLVMQDPTDPTTLTAIGEPSGLLGRTDGILTIESVEPVEAPPPAEPTVDARDLDSGLNAAEIRSIRYALEHEVNPRHLTGFAQTLEPWYPAAASHLRVRSALLEPGASFKKINAPNVSDSALDACRKEIDAEAKKNGIPPDIVKRDVGLAILRIILEPHLPLVARTPAERAASVVVRPIAERADKGAPSETLRVADAERIRKILPPHPRDGFVSPSALKLALATTGKPEISGVLFKQLAPERAQAIEEAREPAERARRIDLLRARDALDKAERCLERSRWTRWYDRVRRLG